MGVAVEGDFLILIVNKISVLQEERLRDEYAFCRIIKAQSTAMSHIGAKVNRKNIRGLHGKIRDVCFIFECGISLFGILWWTID